MKNRKKYLLLVILGFVAGAGLYGYYRFNERNNSLSGESPFARLSADELFNAFEKDETGATRKYADKILAVRGMVRQLSKDDKGGYTVYLSTPDLLKSISCSMDSLYRQSSLSVKTGDSITIKGVCSGALLDIVLIRCVTEK
ncbi:OB-fold protein [Flavitalea flava]